jgi:hypothetical protein
MRYNTHDLIVAMVHERRTATLAFFLIAVVPRRLSLFFVSVVLRN